VCYCNKVIWVWWDQSLVDKPLSFSAMTLLVGSIFHMTRKIVSEMTYNVSMGTLNPTIPYQLAPLPMILSDLQGLLKVTSAIAIICFS